MAATIDVPFYDGDGQLRMTVPVEVDEDGVPPSTVELIGPDNDGQTLRWCYRREPRTGTDARWAYLETSRGLAGDPRPGSPEALHRMLESEKWPIYHHPA